MELAQLFYATMIATGLIVIATCIFVAYQAYILRRFITQSLSTFSSFAESVAATRYSAQYIVSKFLLRFFKGGDSDE